MFTALRRIRHLMTLVFLIISLTGCVPAAVMVGATVGGAVIYDRRGIKTALQDHESSIDAYNWLQSDRALRRHTHISVTVFHHTALMVGQAETAALRARAFQYVTRVKHLHTIYNEVMLGKPISLVKRAEDSWITAKVKAAMLAKRGLRSGQFVVVTENKVVYIMGYATHRQARLASDVARHIHGVKKVVKVVHYPQ